MKKLTGVELTEAEKETIILNITLFGEDKVLLKKEDATIASEPDRRSEEMRLLH